ncbi:MAG: 3'-5' exonuclease, partial [Nitrospirota bacterium]
TEASESPGIDILLPEFISFCRDSILVGHFVSIDLGFLNKELKRIYSAGLQNPAVDTYTVYRWIRKLEQKTCAYHEDTAENADLVTLANKYGIPFEGAHNALNDAFVTAQLFQRFLSVLPGFGVHTAGELMRIGGAGASG